MQSQQHHSTPYLKLYRKNRKANELKNVDARYREQAQESLKRKLEADKAYDEGQIEENETCILARPISLVLSDLKYENDDRIVHRDLISYGRYHLASKKHKDSTVREITNYLNKRPLFKLLDWQEEVQCFIENREADRDRIGSRGLMLCLDMGLGKTLNAISYILYDNQRCFRQTGNRYNGCNLIIVPNKLVLEGWLYEIRTKWPANTFEYFVLQSSKNRQISRAYLEHCCDFVIVTYATVIAAYKDKLNEEEQQYEEDEERSLEEEEEDVVIEVEGNERRVREREYRSDILFKIKWKRIIADESHHINNRATTRFKAMMALQSDIRWAVTGTPIQNKLSDILSNFLFIGVPLPFPINDNDIGEQEKTHIKKILDVVMIRKLKSELNSKDQAMVLMPIVKTIKLIEFESLSEKVIYYLYATYGSRHWQDAIGTSTTSNAKHTNIVSILQIMMQLCMGMRVVNDLVLPNGMLTLGDESQLRLKETQYKESVLPASKPAHYAENDNSLEYFASHLCKKTGFHYKSNSDTVLNLPQGYQLEYHANLASTPQSSLNQREANQEDFEWNPFKKSRHFDLINSYEDRHHYQALYQRLSSEGIENAKTLLKEAKKVNDPCSEAMIKHITARVLRKPHYSTKNRHIIKYILEQVPLEDKVIVFSNTIHSLEDLERDLTAHGIASIMVHGTTRDNTYRIDLFKQASPVNGIKVILLSLKLGNIGLNITCANHVLFMHSWWNPYMLTQAEDRVYRLGQLKIVYIVHFIMNHAIDLYVLNLSHNKKSMNSEIMSKETNSVSRIEDYAYSLYEYSITQ